VKGEAEMCVVARMVKRPPEAWVGVGMAEDSSEALVVEVRVNGLLSEAAVVTILRCCGFRKVERVRVRDRS